MSFYFWARQWQTHLVVRTYVICGVHLRTQKCSRACQSSSKRGLLLLEKRQKIHKCQNTKKIFLKENDSQIRTPGKRLDAIKKSRKGQNARGIPPLTSISCPSIKPPPLRFSLLLYVRRLSHLSRLPFFFLSRRSTFAIMKAANIKRKRSGEQRRKIARNWAFFFSFPPPPDKKSSPPFWPPQGWKGGGWRLKTHLLLPL